MIATESPTRVREPWLLSAKDVAAMLGISRSAVFELKREGFLPSPVRLGGSIVRWRAAELRGWIAAGTPSAEHWEWEPTKTVSLEVYRTSLVRDLERLQGDLRDVAAAIVRGEETIRVRTGA